MSNNMLVIFNHVQGAITALNDGNTWGALRLLTMIEGKLALETMRTLDDDIVGSEQFNEVLEAVAKYQKLMESNEG